MTTPRKNRPSHPRRRVAPMASMLRGLHLDAGRESLAASINEETWLDVIRKMDEVYSELVHNEIELEEKNAELERSHRFVYSVLEAMSDVLVVCDRRGKVQEVNRAFLKLVGRGEAELVGADLASLFADEDSREKVLPLGAAPGPLTDCELRFLAADGKAIAVAVNGSELRDASHHLQGMVLIGRPTGELRRAYQQLTEAHETLKRTQQQLVQTEKMASLGQLVAGVAHELNNPISFILGNVFSLQRYLQRVESYLELVHEGAPPEALAEARLRLRIDHILNDLPSLLDGTIEGAERSRDIVDALKRFSAADRGEESVFDLVEVVQRAVHWVSKAASHRFQVSLALPERLLVKGSPGQLQQVFINLVQNAADATAKQVAPTLAVEGKIEGALLRLSFHDNGPGIPPEALSKIFDPFFTTKPIGKGTGLGLSISYGIVERHGGNLSVGNHPQGGAEFVLSLPLAG